MRRNLEASAGTCSTKHTFFFDGGISNGGFPYGRFVYQVGSLFLKPVILTSTERRYSVFLKGRGFVRGHSSVGRLRSALPNPGRSSRFRIRVAIGQIISLCGLIALPVSIGFVLVGVLGRRRLRS